MLKAIRQRPAIGVALSAVCLLAAALSWTMRGRGEPAGLADAYYLDLNTMKVFRAAGPRSPVAAPSGPASDGSPAGYKAYVFACGPGLDPVGLSLEELKARGGGIAFISRYTDDGAAAQKELAGANFPDNDKRYSELTTRARAGHMVRAPEGTQWFQSDSSTANDLLTAISALCKDGRPQRLVPPGSREWD